MLDSKRYVFEPCKLCTLARAPFVFTVILPPDRGPEAKYDTGLAMMRHVYQYHPEALGIDVEAERKAAAVELMRLRGELN